MQRAPIQAVRGWNTAAVVVSGLMWSTTVQAQLFKPEALTAAPNSPTPPPVIVHSSEPRHVLPPLNFDYLQFGVALDFLFAVNPGPVCPDDADVPCILGSGAGLAGRAGYRSRGPWYIGGAYSLAKLDTKGLMRVGILQQLRAEVCYLFNLGQRTEPYVAAGIGGLSFGNEWAAEGLGLTTFAGLGFEIQLSRTTVVGLAANYRPMFFFEWTDKAGQVRESGVAHFWGLEVKMEARDALGSHSQRGR
ncbi:MAG: hypothetical protein CSA75_00855 [Sorangium cellulosum]|nr:MAG: hypothetical protein CSA75_00855 [Sorangium cellulosum]